MSKALSSDTKKSKGKNHKKSSKQNRDVKFEQETLPQKQINRMMHSSKDYREDLYRRFQNFNTKQSFIKIRQNFKALVGRHSAIDYHQNFNFKERWEQQTQINSNKRNQGALIFLVVDAIGLLVMVLSMWGLTITPTFKQSNFQWIYFLTILVSVQEIVKILFGEKSRKCERKTTLILNQGLCMCLSSLLFVQEQLQLPKLVQIAFNLYLLINIYKKSSKIYERIKIYHISDQYRQILNLFDLFWLLIVVTHFFALILYQVAMLNPHNNWVNNVANMEDHNWDTQYIYSLYFSCTTLLTVGYGDISPSNKSEIGAVLLTQIIGIATFAYAVNQLGSVISHLHQRRQKLNKQLAKVQRISNQYDLEPEVLCRMRNELTRSTAVREQLGVEEQNQLIGKFSDDLRTNIQFESSLKIIKRSLFMICNWTGKLQAKIASRLVKQIYTVEEFLPQVPGKQKIFILERGRIDILNNFKNNNRFNLQKVLKTIKVVKETEIATENVYGYSAVISTHKINLKAISKENSICYTISKCNFIQIMQESEEDLQHMHQIKSNIDLSKVPQEIQAPSITNIRQHYRPSSYFVIKQQNSKHKKKNSRSTFHRKNKRSALILKEADELCANPTEKLIKMGGGKQLWDKIENGTFNFSPFQQQEELVVTNKEIKQAYGFQSCKEFQRYFKKSNYDCIVKKISTLNYIKNYNNILSRSKSLANMKNRF